jgi:hypothetical protein
LLRQRKCGSRRSCLQRHAKTPDHVSLNASYKQTVRGCPPFKSFDSLPPPVCQRIISIPTPSLTPLFILPKPPLIELALSSFQQTAPPSSTSSPLQTRTLSIPGGNSPAQGEDVRLQARYVHHCHISSISKSLEVNGNTLDELATWIAKAYEEERVSKIIYTNV